MNLQVEKNICNSCKQICFLADMSNKFKMLKISEYDYEWFNSYQD